MISKSEFRKSPKFTMLRAKVKAALDADPYYIQVISDRDDARNMYKQLEQQMQKYYDLMTHAKDDEEEAEEKMRDIQKEVIYSLIPDPEDAETVYHYYYD